MQTTRMYTYDEAVKLYRQQKRDRFKHIMFLFKGIVKGIFTKQRIYGLVSMIIITILSLYAKNPITLFIIIPVCLGLVFTKEDMI